MQLERYLHIEEQHGPAYYLSEKQVFSKYRKYGIPYVFGADYSKLTAISRLEHDIPESISDHSMEQTLRWLLTDRGLLFSQTRERYYPDHQHNLRIYTEDLPYYQSCLNTKPAWQPNRRSRIQAIGTYAYQCRKQSFDEPYPFLLTCDASNSAILLILNKWKGSLLEVELIGDDPGYCKGSLANLFSEHPTDSDYQSVMNQWLDNTTIRLGTLGTFPVKSLFEDILSSTEALFEFLTSILPRCIYHEKLYQDCLEACAPYVPSLAVEDAEEYLLQAKAFQAEDFSKWKIALPVLPRYLNPIVELPPQALCCEPDPADGLPTCALLLEKAFKQYLNQMEPCKSTESVKDTDQIKALAVWFAGFGTEDHILFMERPSIIFQLFRSPLYRYIYQYNDRNWNISRVIRYACYTAPLPITVQSLNADHALYTGIVEACRQYCGSTHIMFPVEAWLSLWDCIEQCTKATAFNAADLFCTKYNWRQLLNTHDPGYALLDRWLQERCTTPSSPQYIDLWRTLISKHCNPSRKESTVLQEGIHQYRVLFESYTTDAKPVFELLHQLGSEIGWNKINASMTQDERKRYADDYSIQEHARHGAFSVIRSGKDSSVKSGEERVSRVAELQLMEWMLLQCTSDCASRQLMQCVLHLLK